MLCLWIMDQVGPIIIVAGINAALLFVAMFLTRIHASLAGLAVFAASMTAIDMLSPNLFVALAIGTVAFWVLAMKLTDASGAVDILLFVAVLNLITIIYVFAIVPRLAGMG